LVLLLNQTTCGLQLARQVGLGSAPKCFATKRLRSGLRAQLGLRHSGLSLHPHLAILQTSTFAVSPSSPCRIGTDRRPQIRSLRDRVFVIESSPWGLRRSGHAQLPHPVFESSYLRTVAEGGSPNSSPRGCGHSSEHPEARLYGA